MVRESDESSRGILYEKYNPIIRNIANEYYRKYSGYGYEFDDFLQEGYIAFQNALSKYDDTKDCLFYTFVVFCLRRSLGTFCRRISNRRKNISNTEVVDIDDCSCVDVNSDTNDIVLNMHFDEELRLFLYSLPFEISNVLELRINNFSYTEIGLLLDIPISTVNFRCKKVREAVRSFLNNYYSEKAN